MQSSLPQQYFVLFLFAVVQQVLGDRLPDSQKTEIIDWINELRRNLTPPGTYVQSVTYSEDLASKAEAKLYDCLRVPVIQPESYFHFCFGTGYIYDAIGLLKTAKGLTFQHRRTLEDCDVNDTCAIMKQIYSYNTTEIGCGTAKQLMNKDLEVLKIVCFSKEPYQGSKSLFKELPGCPNCPEGTMCVDYVCVKGRESRADDNWGCPICPEGTECVRSLCEVIPSKKTEYQGGEVCPKTCPEGTKCVGSVCVKDSSTNTGTRTLPGLALITFLAAQIFS